MEEEQTATETPSDGRHIGLTDLNQHIVCVLCFGYFIDATTITDCMHTFCKSCIVNFLSTNHHCPHCDMLLSRTRPLSSLRPDRIMQAIVYKTVPGLFQNEMKRRVQYYQNNSSSAPDFTMDEGIPENYVFNPDDSISLAVRYYQPRTKENDPSSTDSPIFVRYFRCPATVPVHVLKSLIKTKHRIPDTLRVELLYGEERLQDPWTLMEVGYIFGWTRETPMELTFQVIAVRIVKRKRLVLKKVSKPIPKRSLEEPTSSDIPQKPPKISRTENRKLQRIDSPPHFSLHDDAHHHRPPTPPETPERISEDHHDPSFSMRRMTPRQDDSEPPQTQFIEHEVMDDEALDPQDTPEDVPMEEDSPEPPLEDEPDSDAPLEVDTSHDTEQEDAQNFPEEEDVLQEPKIEVEEHQEDTLPEEHNDAEESNEVYDKSQEKETPEETSEESPTEKGDPVITPDSSDQRISEDSHGNCSSPKSGDSEESDVLDFSCHARTVRAQRETSVTSSTPSPSPPSKESKSPVSDLNKQVVPTCMGAMLGNAPGGMASPLMSPRPPLPMDWVRPGFPGAPGVIPPPAFRDLMTLSHAAVQLQLAMAHAQAQAQAQVQAQKLQNQENVLKNLKATESLSFVNGSGDTLTISPIAGTGKSKQNVKSIKAPSNTRKNNNCKNTPNNNNTVKKVPNQVSRSKSSTNNTTKSMANGHKSLNGSLAGSAKTHVTSSNINNGTPSLTRAPVTSAFNGANRFNSTPYNTQNKMNKLPSMPPLQRMVKPPATPLKQSTPKPQLPNVQTKTVVSTSMSSLKIPYVQLNPCKVPTSKSEKDKKEVDSKSAAVDEPFKITNQKLIECMRQQRLQQNNKMKGSSTDKPSTETTKTTGSTTTTTVKSPPVTIKSPPISKPNPTPQNIPSNKPNLKPVCPTASAANKTNGKSLQAAPIASQSKPMMKTLASPTSPPHKLNIKSSPLVSSAIASSKPIIKTTCVTIPTTTKSMNLTSLATTSSVSIRTTNTSVRQIPNPSRLHQQSESRISAGITRPLLPGRKNFGTSSGDRLESLTRSLHEKVAASAAGMFKSLAR